MKLGRWFGSLVLLTGAALLVVLPALAQDAVKFEWKAFDKGKVFYQKLTTKTEQTMKVQGQEVKQNQEQTFLVKWTGLEAKEGTFVVQQQIIAVKMKIDIGGVQINYDSAEDKVNNPMTDFFKKLLEADLTLTIDKATMKVTDIKGHEELIKKLGVTNPQMEPLLNKILSKEALKEMAEPTWGAFPTTAVTKGKDWTPQASKLNLGPIGTYETKYTYTYEGPDPKLGEKIKVGAVLTYGVPTDKAGLPFQIKSATLKSTEGAGYAYFDKAKGRFESSTIRMKLDGVLSIEVGGMTTDVTLSQDQTATSESSDQDPRAAKK